MNYDGGLVGRGLHLEEGKRATSKSHQEMTRVMVVSAMAEGAGESRVSAQDGQSSPS